MVVMKQRILICVALLTLMPMANAGVFEERELLARYAEYIKSAEKLLEEAQLQTDPERRIKFDYEAALKRSEMQALTIEHYFYAPTVDFQEYIESKHD